MPRYALLIEYDGRPFAGWQRQPDQPSVQGAVETALSRLEPDVPSIATAGRTDAGVHALGQVAHCDMAREWDLFRLTEAVNYHLKPQPVAVVAAALIMFTIALLCVVGTFVAAFIALCVVVGAFLGSALHDHKSSMTSISIQINIIPDHIEDTQQEAHEELFKRHAKEQGVVQILSGNKSELGVQNPRSTRRDVNDWKQKGTNQESNQQTY